MTLHTEAVTEQMSIIAKKVFDTLDPAYYLAGGTALALTIGHRKSIDLDYFIAKDIDIQKLEKQIFEVFSGAVVEITFKEKNTLWCNIDGVKVSFISRFEPMITPVETHKAFRLASISDLTVMKLSAICGREEYKDYFDLACLAREADVDQWVSLWKMIYPHVDSTSWIVALAAVDEVAEIPLDIFSPFVSLDVREVLSLAVSNITVALSA